jgi:hypothetical protein
MTTFRRLGPRVQVCTLCRVRLSTNALARAAHERSKLHQKELGEAR